MEPSSYSHWSGSFRTRHVPQGYSLSHFALRFLLCVSIPRSWHGTASYSPGQTRQLDVSSCIVGLNGQLKEPP